MAQMEAFMHEQQDAEDEFLRAVAALAAHGNWRILPQSDDVLGPGLRPILILPERMFKRLRKVAAPCDPLTRSSIFAKGPIA
ncbi:hypothetical protein ORIO_02155 [Cereibacter azotoformans]|uniref:hypothetical protein n=1 Tax=Cereibacter azotoformans TaxID=43057 RepID=UPI0002D6697A|nr:hypothetical protein [Cereibacter azotoformans]ULB08739.1 hypothetical protein ORIO_02155 [Cereibacter azotoformans]